VKPENALALIPNRPAPEGVYNLWCGFGVEPKAGEWRTIKQHLLEVVSAGNGDHFDWLTHWMAYCVQHPERPAETSTVLRGAKGTGKGLTAQLMGSVFRGHALHVTNSRHLTGHFNAHLADTLFLFVDEAFWAGDKQGESTLKALITEPQLTIEPKGIDAFQVPNRLKIMMASNNDWVVPVSPDERRYFVLDVSDQRKGDKAYFTRLAAAIGGPELAAFLAYLLELDLSGFDHRNPPHTEGLNEQKLRSLNSVQSFWLDCLSHGEIPGTGLADWPDEISTQVFHAAYADHAHDHGDRYPLTANHMSAELAKLLPGGQRLAKGRAWAPDASGRRPRSYKLPDLEGARKSFLEAMRIDPISYQWETDDE
jgi:phage/plasmid-associated DNA primase